MLRMRPGISVWWKDRLVLAGTIILTENEDAPALYFKAISRRLNARAPAAAASVATGRRSIAKG
jgi:hypothetical protein